MGEIVVDRALDVRPGEELNTERLSAHLMEAIDGLEGPMTLKQYLRGHSNLTYQLEFGERKLVLRRPPFGAQIKSGHDMFREYRVLSGLKRVYSRVPQTLHYCEDEMVIGCPFYVMEQLSGCILRQDTRAPEALTPAIMTSLSESFVDNLAALHAVDVEEAGLSDLGRPDGYVERQVSGWTRRYENAKTEDLLSVDDVARWLAANRPPDSGAALIHNDYKYDNLVLNPGDLTEIVGVLDWEMATVGDPLMDLGTTLGYWVQADDSDAIKSLPFGSTELPGNYTRQQLVDRYSEVTGRNVDHALFYYVYGLFKITVIVQQIYSRYVMGFTNDPRFAAMGKAVKILGKTAAAAVELGRIDGLSGR